MWIILRNRQNAQSSPYLGAVCLKGETTWYVTSLAPPTTFESVEDANTAIGGLKSLGHDGTYEVVEWEEYLKDAWGSWTSERINTNSWLQQHKPSKVVIAKPAMFTVNQEAESKARLAFSNDNDEVPF